VKTGIQNFMDMKETKIINGNCWVACFDLLGFENRVNDFVEQNGEGHLDVFVKVYYKDVLEEAKRRVKQHKKLLAEINYVWFSDTFLFYIPIDKKGYAAIAIDSLARIFFVGCIWQRFVLRGALSAGEFYSEPEENIYVGPALIDAYRYMEKQEWIGLVISPKARFELAKINLCPPDRGKYIEYDVPVKTKEKNINSEVELKLETEKLFSFKMQIYQQVEERIREMQRETKTKLSKMEYDKVKAKYENSLKFINDTKH